MVRQVKMVVETVLSRNSSQFFDTGREVKLTRLLRAYIIHGSVVKSKTA